MFGNFIKKLVPVAIAGAAAYTGTKMFGGSNLWASSDITKKFGEKLTKEAIKKGMKNIFASPSDPVNPKDYNVDFSNYLMEVAASSKTGSGGGFGDLKAADSQAIAYQWQQRLNAYIGGDRI
mgnify:CR=1 FL=1